MNCQAGCKRFDGEEVRHHKDCVYYPESLSEPYDNLEVMHMETLDKYNELISRCDNLIGQSEQLHLHIVELLKEAPELD